jgi:hypothetical protein
MTRSRRGLTLRRMDDLLDLRARLLKAVARRDAERPESPAWHTADAEIEALTRRVWETDEPAGEAELEAS